MSRILEYIGVLELGVKWGYLKKLIFPTLFMISGLVFSQSVWVHVVDTAAGAVVYYAPSTIKRDGDRARVWALVDLPYKLPNGSLSFREYWEMNCEEVSYKILQHEDYPENRLGGLRISGETDAGDWRYIGPGGGADELIFKKVCS